MGTMLLQRRRLPAELRSLTTVPVTVLMRLASACLTTRQAIVEASDGDLSRAALDSTEIAAVRRTLNPNHENH